MPGGADDHRRLGDLFGIARLDNVHDVEAAGRLSFQRTPGHRLLISAETLAARFLKSLGSAPRANDGRPCICGYARPALGGGAYPPHFHAARVTDLSSSGKRHSKRLDRSGAEGTWTRAADSQSSVSDNARPASRASPGENTAAGVGLRRPTALRRLLLYPPRAHASWPSAGSSLPSEVASGADPARRQGRSASGG